ncbi:hypothetical protein AVEN_174812-1 [Araneus ventricosus]|uniref:Uncharacterized protein n=1 Tax=Araneus ventricosus TaxID=182803 RepID=A0A4Y2P348_ARAVE|nr:hypothetical protein AVEN_174812-1 [Araneus ventricosus]
MLKHISIYQHELFIQFISPSALHPYYLSFILTVDNDLYNSDHFTLILTDSLNNPTSPFSPPKYILNAAYWEKFTSLATINSDIVKSATIDESLNHIVNIIMEAADNSIPKTFGNRRKQNKLCGKDDFPHIYRKQRKDWYTFHRDPTIPNFIQFKKTRAESRKIQRRSRIVSWQKFFSGITFRMTTLAQYHP